MVFGELALRMAEPGEVEAQDRDAHRGQPRGDAARGDDVLAAGEAMREERGRQVRAFRQVEPRRRASATGMAGKGDAFGGHGGLPRSVAVQR